MSNTSFRTFSTAAKASMRPASMPVKVRSPYNMSSMLQEITDIEARYKGPANAANMTLDELWDDYVVRHRRAGPVLMWREPWMPEPECELLPYEAPKPETPKPREYYLQMVLYEGPETDEEKPEEPEDKPANASEATPEPATRPRQGIFDSIWAETPSSRSYQSQQQQQPQTQKSTTSSQPQQHQKSTISSSQPQQHQKSSSPSSYPPKKSSPPCPGPPEQTKPTSSSPPPPPPKQASRFVSRENHKKHCSSPPSNKPSLSDHGETHKNHHTSSSKTKTTTSDRDETHKQHRRHHNHKSAKKQQHHQQPQTQASMPRNNTIFNTPLSHAHPVPHPLPNPTKKGHGSINDSMWAS